MNFTERLKYVEDCVLSFIQRRCDHPSKMVAADLLESDVDGLEVNYCRRCGAVKTNWIGLSRNPTWRRPDPHLWRG